MELVDRTVSSRHVGIRAHGADSPPDRAGRVAIKALGRSDVLVKKHGESFRGSDPCQEVAFVLKKRGACWLEHGDEFGIQLEWDVPGQTRHLWFLVGKEGQ